jgi:hypothetical protein
METTNKEKKVVKLPVRSLPHLGKIHEGWHGAPLHNFSMNRIPTTGFTPNCLFFQARSKKMNYSGYTVKVFLTPWHPLLNSS